MRRDLIALLAFSALPVAIHARAAADVRTVPADFPTIPDAFAASFDGDTILVAPGTWSGPIDFAGRDIALRAVAGPAVTTIDGGILDDSIVTFSGGESRAASIDGFTFVNGNGRVDTASGGIDRRGGAILILDAAPTIRNCVFRNNTVNAVNGDAYGGAIFARGTPLIAGCSFIENSVNGLCDGYAGAVDVTQSIDRPIGDQATTINACAFLGNAARSGSCGGVGFAAGGALRVADGTITNCIFARNRVLAAGTETQTARGGAVSIVSPGTVSIVATTCTDNIAETFDPTIGFFVMEHGADVDGGGFLSAVLAASIFANDIVDPVNRFDGDIRGCLSTQFFSGGGGNLLGVPEFVAPDDDNYRLTATSLGVDTGNPADFMRFGITTDRTGYPRFVAGDIAPEIGAYERPSPMCTADLDGDGFVATPDLILLLGQWGPCPDATCSADLDANNTIGIPDLLVLLAQFNARC